MIRQQQIYIVSSEIPCLRVTYALLRSYLEGNNMPVIVNLNGRASLKIKSFQKLDNSM